MRIDELAEAIRTGGWRSVCFVDGSFGAMQIYRSIAEPRVQAVKRVPKRGKPTVTYSFGDPNVDVPILPGKEIVEEADYREFADCRDLARCIIEHDTARDWERSAP